MKFRIKPKTAEPAFLVQAESLIQAKANNPGMTVNPTLTLPNGVEISLPTYFSPSALGKFYKDPEAYVRDYLLIHRPERTPQSYQMMFGSAVDGAIKHFLAKRFYKEVPEEYEYDTIIKAQCDERFWNKDHKEYVPEHDAFAWAEHLLQQYRNSGAMSDLANAILASGNLPKFEFALGGDVETKFGAVPVFGYPDFALRTSEDAQIILDFKANSIATERNTSPIKGYVKVGDGWKGTSLKNSKNNGMKHKDAKLFKTGGLYCNSAGSLKDVNESWATQVILYSWMMGTEVGSPLVAGIHQLVGQKTLCPKTKLNNIKVAQHHYEVSAAEQFALQDKLGKAWANLQRGYIFTGMTYEDNCKKIKELNDTFGQLAGPDSKEAWLKSFLTPSFFRG